MTAPLDRLKDALAHRYEILRDLGAGGMATVYLARDLKLQRQVALKVLRPELAQSLGPERFLREIEIAAQLHHPHILALHDSGDVDGILYYVMPYVEGESLRARIDREGALPVADAARILREMADALAFAHAWGVVHRDIKPDNVMLSGRHALVMDFGIAKAVSEASGDDKVTTIGMALGTPTYMAPEQAVADPHVDHRADIYALGATAYEMLTGSPPFTGRTPQEVLAAHVTKAAEPVTSVRDSVPQPLADLVMACLEKRPADRPQSAEELLPTLEALASSSGGITPTTAISSARRAPRRTRVLVVVGALALAAAAYGAFHFTATGRSGTLIGDKALASNDLLLVSEFTNETSDTTLAATVTDAIRVELQLTDVVRVMSQDEMWEALRRMQLPPNTALVDTTLRQLAEREGVKGYVTGAIRPIGNGYQLTAQVVDAANGQNLRVARVTARNDDELIGAVEELGKTLRTNIGESLRSVRGTPALAKVTTASLPALRAYVSGIRAARFRLPSEAVVQLREAVALDSGFAAAWLALTAQYMNTAQASLARDAIDHAYRFQDRLSDDDRRLSVQAAYHRFHDEPALAEAAFRQLVERRDVSGMANYSDFLLGQRRFADAETVGRLAIEEDPRIWVGYWNTAEAQVAQGKWQAVDTIIKRMADSAENPGAIRELRFRTAMARRAYDSVIPMLPQVTNSNSALALRTCVVEEYLGQLSRSPPDCGFFKRWLRLRLLADTAGVVTYLSTLDPDSLESRRFALLIMELAEAGQVARAKEWLNTWRRRFGEDDLEFRIGSHAAHGAIALADGDPRRAITEFLAWHDAPFPTGNHNFARGLPEAAVAYERLGMPDSAQALLEAALATPSLGAQAVYAYDELWYGPTLRKLGELYAAKGERDKAIAYYQKFIDLWRNADPDIQPQVADARQRLAKLVGEPGA